MQFHPEVNHTQHGADMIRRFLYGACGAAGDTRTKFMAHGEKARST